MCNYITLSRRRTQKDACWLRQEAPMDETQQNSSEEMYADVSSELMLTFSCMSNAACCCCCCCCFNQLVCPLQASCACDVSVQQQQQLSSVIWPQLDQPSACVPAVVLTIPLQSHSPAYWSHLTSAACMPTCYNATLSYTPWRYVILLPALRFLSAFCQSQSSIDGL